MKGTGEERLAALDCLYLAWDRHTVWSRFETNAERYGSKIFIIYQDREYTYKEVLEEAKRRSRSLYALGVRPGDHVALLLYNSPEYLYMLFGIARLGAVKIPVNMKLAEEEKVYVLRQSKAKWALGERLPAGKEKMPQMEAMVPREQWEEFLRGGDTVSEEQMERLERENRNPDGLCDIMYTSGSSGFPKGVKLTHSMLLRSSYGTCRTRMMEEGRRLFVPIPFYHIMAYAEGVLPALYVGGTLILTDRKFDPEYGLDLMRRHQANDIICVSLLMMKLLQEGHPRPEDFLSMHAAYWASTCPEWVWDEGRRAFGIRDVTTGYGMTECGSTTTIISPLAPPDQVKTMVGGLKDGGAAGRPEWSGRLLEIKICCPETGQELRAGEKGELLCRGLTVTPGYFENEEANKRCFTEDGWFRTGDLGSIDENGIFTFCGRKNDVYKINGENVSPQYLDQIIGRCPEVNQVEVVGIRHERYGEVGVAFIDAGDVTEEKKHRIEEFCRKKLASFQVPRYYVYGSHSQWPCTASGKVQKRKLREIAEKMFSQ